MQVFEGLVSDWEENRQHVKSLGTSITDRLHITLYIYIYMYIYIYIYMYIYIYIYIELVNQVDH